MALNKIFFVYMALAGAAAGAILVAAPHVQDFVIKPYFWVLIAVGLFGWKIELEVPSGPVTATLEGFHELRLAEADIRALAEGKQEVDWIPPPDSVAF